MYSIVACVPVRFAPNHDVLNKKSTWERAKCPECEQEMWLGNRSKSQVEAGAKMVCMECLVKMPQALSMPVIVLQKEQ